MVALAKRVYLCFLVLLGLGLSSSFRVLKPVANQACGELNHQLWEFAAGPSPPATDNLDNGELYHQMKSSVPPRIESSGKLEFGEGIGISTGLGGFGVGVAIGEGNGGTEVNSGIGEGIGYGGSGSTGVVFGPGSGGGSGYGVDVGFRGDTQWGGDVEGCPRACFQCSQSLSGICCPSEQITGSPCPSQCFKCSQSPNGFCCPDEVIKQLCSQRAAMPAKTGDDNAPSK